MLADCGAPSRKSAKSKPVPAIGCPFALNWLVSKPVKVSVPRPFWSVCVARSLRWKDKPNEIVCEPRFNTTPSDNDARWLRVNVGEASFKAPKFVKLRLGGPKFSGLVEV